MQNDTPFDQSCSDQVSIPCFTHPSDGLQSQSKIQPIPIIRKSLPNSPNIRARLRLNAYKNFSKISAAGPQTLQVLQKIKESSSLKMTYKFEFDPYFCDESCLTELNIVLKKIKTIKQLSLIIRRYELTYVSN